MEFVLLAVLLLAAIFIIVAVIFQRSADEGLSGAIAGEKETYYGKERSGGVDKMWYKWTLIAAVVFAVAVIVAYVIQPDFSYGFDLDYWQSLSDYSKLFN